MDLARLPEFRDVAEGYFAAASKSNPGAIQKALGKILGIMTEYIEQKRQQPDGLLISQLVLAQWTVPRTVDKA